MVCKRCGKKTSDNYQYCEHCGAKLTSDISQEEQELLNLNQQNENMIRSLREMEPPKKRPLKVRILIWVGLWIGCTLLCLLSQFIGSLLLTYFQ